MDESSLRQALIATAEALYARGYALATLGSLSARLDAERFLALPAAAPKDSLRPAQLVRCSIAAPAAEEAPELALHRAVYQGRPAAAAAIHAHPVSVLACSLVGIHWDRPLLPEAVLGVGPIAQLPAWFPGSAPLPCAVRGAVARCAAVIFARGGVLTAGPDLAEALYLVERVDQVAQVFVKSAQLGRIRHLPADEVARLEAMRAPQP